MQNFIPEYFRIILLPLYLVLVISILSCGHSNNNGNSGTFFQNNNLSCNDNSSDLHLEQELAFSKDMFGSQYSRIICTQGDISKIDSAANNIRYTIRNSNPEQVINTLNSLVYTTWEIQFDSNRNDLQNMLPGSVLHNRKGSCIGISSLYLLLAEKLSLPIYGVVVPGHFFVTYDNGVFKRNIESLAKGEHRDDSWYKENFGTYTGRISSSQFAGLIFYNAGNIYLQNRDIPMALKMYRSALHKKLNLAQCFGNLAITHDITGNLDSALHYIMIARRIDPQLKGIQQSTAILLNRAGRYNEAIEIYKELLLSERENASLYYDLACAYLLLNKIYEAKETLSKLIDITKDYPGIDILLKELES